MLEHLAAAIDCLVTATVTPIAVDRFEFEAAATLFVVKVIAFVVRVDCACATIAPKHDKKCR